MRWLRSVVAVALCGCGPAITPTAGDESGGVSTAGPGSSTSEDSDAGESEATGPTTSSAVVYLQFDRRDVQRPPRSVHRVGLDGVGDHQLAELHPDTVDAAFLGSSAEEAAVVASFGVGTSQAILIRERDEPYVIDGFGGSVWLAPDADGVWTSEPDGVSFRSVAGEVTPFVLGGPVLQLSASRRWAWIAEPYPELHDLHEVFEPSFGVPLRRPTDDYLCEEEVEPGLWANSDATTVLGFPWGGDHALGQRPLACGSLCAWGVEGTPRARDVIGWDTCRDRLLGLGDNGTVYALAPNHHFESVTMATRLSDATFGFSPDGRFIVGAGRQDEGPAVVVVDLEAGTAIPEVIAGSGSLAVGHVGSGYATILHRHAVEATYTSHRLTLATGDLVDVEHCGDFTPLALDDGRVLACERDGGLGNVFGPVTPGEPIAPIGEDAVSVRLADEPTRCVDTGVLPIVTEHCE